ncbi:hypothetical protein PsB1_1053 [Candidatus Phycosocius spiralis]|uniref:Cell division protein FtsQ n=1 Tax=Candidatus Phycosocius spiralis TaxID=2815099 RepID=A0ABQ4PV70_9PROT|nr:hypothetical protein PsB1_1053 [Candidatus Phycosocius spiralis]
MRAAQYNGPTRKFLLGATLGSVLAIFLMLASGLGVLDDLGRGIKTSSETMARSAGLAVRFVSVQPSDGKQLSAYQRAQAEVQSGVLANDVMFGVDPNKVRAQVAQLPWVEDVVVRRLWPDQIQIVITPRAATALWQVQGQLSFIDASGRTLGKAEAIKSAKGYAMVIGAKAGPNAPALFEALRNYPMIARRTSAAIWVGDRRWNLLLKNGGDILLPEVDMPQALGQLAKLQVTYQLLDRPFSRIDMRQSGILIIRPAQQAITTDVAPGMVKSLQGV